MCYGWSREVEFINICKAPNIEIILEIVFSIYSSNAYIERVFSIMKNICSDDRFKLWTANLKAELCVKINYNFKCSQFYYYIKNNDKLLKACKSNSKYTFKLKKYLYSQYIYWIKMKNLVEKKIKVGTLIYFVPDWIE